MTRWIQREYNNPEVFITESGWADQGEMEDTNRIEYLHDHLLQVLDIVLNSKCNLKGYTGLVEEYDWSFLLYHLIYSSFEQFGPSSIILSGVVDIRMQYTDFFKLSELIHIFTNFSEKFGLYSVNMNSTRKERTAKKSAHFMKEVTTTRRIPHIH